MTNKMRVQNILLETSMTGFRDESRFVSQFGTGCNRCLTRNDALAAAGYSAECSANVLPSGRGVTSYIVTSYVTSYVV